MDIDHLLWREVKKFREIFFEFERLCVFLYACVWVYVCVLLNGTL